MQNHIEEADDLVIRFKQETLLEIFEHEDVELHAPVEERFDLGEEVEVTVFGVDLDRLDVQFGDGTVAFIRREQVEIVKINDEIV